MSTHTSTAKRQQITLTQLSSYDDILTDVLIDHAYYWTTIPKNRPSYRPSRGVTEEEITNIIQTHLIVDPDLDVAESKLLATDGLGRFYNALRTAKEQSDFRAHLQRYMRIHLPDCPFEVNSTNRYTIYNHEAAITARKFIKRGQPIKYLSGIQVMITAKEDKELAKRKKDFSIVISARNKCAALFMGPARFANHDCNANARLVITGQAGIEIVAARNIEVGDEITVSYAANYFGADNCECLCKTCEDNVVNGWAPGEGGTMVKKSIENLTTEGYGLRRRRRDGSCASGSRTSSVTPDIRPRIRRTKPKIRDGGQAQELSYDSPTPYNILRQKRKREYESLQSPPMTPEKRAKTAPYELESIPISGGLESRTSDDTTSSERSASSPLNSDTAMTDVTTPEEEIQKTRLHSPVLTPSHPRILALANEDSDLVSLTDFSRTPSMPPASNTENANTAGSNTGPFTVPDESSKAAQADWDSSASLTIGQSDEVSSIDLLAIPGSGTAVLEETLPISIISPRGVLEAMSDETRRGRARKRDDHQSEGEPNKAELTDEAVQVTKKRTPGDYTLTPVLLSEASMAWIHCTICGDAFVQQNAYYTRSSCFRCERHSKLYGYLWPKTEKDGPNDKEERVLDHRTIHRFLDRDDEARIRGRKLPAPYQPRPRAVTHATDASPVDDASPKKRGPRKPRKAPEPASDGTCPQSNDESPAIMQRPKRLKRPTLKAASC